MMLHAIHFAEAHANDAHHVASHPILASLTVFILSVFIGIEVISRVPSLLHTPLMSGSNAIHGVILVGAMIVLGQANSTTEQILGFFAVFLATLNVVGGFVVTDRMLGMFKTKPQAPKNEGASK
jgi:NAD(P) transhydrogenase subunit alpha